jgi:hypothetical protein
MLVLRACHRCHEAGGMYDWLTARLLILQSVAIVGVDPLRAKVVYFFGDAVECLDTKALDTPAV